MPVARRRWYHTLFRHIFNFVGVLNGYTCGGCRICGDNPWWKKDHTIMYTKTDGACHICAECWETASDKQIIDATIHFNKEGRRYSSWAYEEDRLLMDATKRELSQRGK